MGKCTSCFGVRDHEPSYHGMALRESFQCTSCFGVRDHSEDFIILTA